MKDNPGTPRAGAQEIAALDGAAQSAEIDRHTAVLKDLLNKIHQRNPLELRAPAPARPAPAAGRLSDLDAPGQDADDFAHRSATLVDESWPLRAPSQSPSTADLNAPPRVAVDEVCKLDDWSQAEEIARHFSALLALTSMSASTRATTMPPARQGEVDAR